MVDQFETTKTW